MPVKTSQFLDLLLKAPGKKTPPPPCSLLKTWRGCFSQISHFCISGGGFLQKIPIFLEHQYKGWFKIISGVPGFLKVGAIQSQSNILSGKLFSNGCKRKKGVHFESVPVLLYFFIVAPGRWHIPKIKSFFLERSLCFDTLKSGHP